MYLLAKLLVRVTSLAVKMLSPPKRVRPRGDPGTVGRTGLPVTSAGARGPVVGQAAHRPPSHRFASAPRSEGPLHLIRGGAFRMAGPGRRVAQTFLGICDFKVFKSALSPVARRSVLSIFHWAISPRVCWATAWFRCDTERDGPRTPPGGSGVSVGRADGEDELNGPHDRSERAGGRV